MDWDQPEDIAEALMEKYPDINPLDLAFPRLLDMIMGLEGFEGKVEGNLEGRMERVVEIWWREYQQKQREKT